ncbi:hypothetical protein RJ639_024230, partial [Escallonia herrerae]
QVLETISSSPQNKYWSNISRGSCGGGLNQIFTTKIFSNVTCDCSFNSSSVCHVTNIQLKGLNLTGVLPAEFANLSYLREIDLTRNYINGSIPTTFGQVRLTILSLLGNRISGSIPKEIGDIATLEVLTLEDNLLGGPLPQNLGSLSNLTRLRIDGSTLCGKIPDFIGNWTKLDRL